MFVRVGSRSFRLQKSLFSNPGDLPNFFTLTCSSAYTGACLEPSGSHEFIRPEPLSPPSLPNRSSALFSDILGFLEGSAIEIRSEEHRAKLIAECKFYGFRNLEQRLVEHHIQHNRCRKTEEITLNLKDVRKDCASLLGVRGGYRSVFYNRPFVDTGKQRELIFQIDSDENAALIKSPPKVWEVCFYDETREQVLNLVNFLCEIYGLKMNIGTNGFIVDVQEAAIQLNGKIINALTECTEDPEEEPSYGTSTELCTEIKKRKMGPQTPLQMVCRKSQWRLKTDGQQALTLQLICAECFCGQRYWNSLRNYLSA